MCEKSAAFAIDTAPPGPEARLRRGTGFAGRLLRILLLAATVWAPVGNASAQEYFGKNKVNYSAYDWRYVETRHFTIYFDSASLPVAEFAARESERALEKIQKDLNYTLHNRVPIVVYSSHNGFSETNISPGEDIPEFVGGFTEFAQNRVVVPFQGSYAELRHVLHHELSHAVTVELWTGGGGLAAMVAQPGAMPPMWVVEGLPEYLSLGWDIDADNLMRDATITGYVPPIDQINGGIFAYKGGQSIFDMIEQTYGRDKVAEFVSAIHSAHSVDRALKTSVGIGLEEMNEAWQRWLKRQYWNDINLHNDPEEVYQALIDHTEDRSVYNLAPTFSPQSDKIAYITDRRGYTDIELISAIDGKPLGRLVEGERSSSFESLFLLRPAISWSPDGRQIAFAAKAGDRNTLYTLDVRKKRIKKRFKFDLDGLFEPTWSPDGKRIAVAGLKDGWSDVYVVTLSDASLTRITHDPYDEKNLKWSPDGNWIAMSSDRPDTSLVFSGGQRFSYGHYDIFLLRPDGSELRHVVANEGQDTDPAWSADGRKLAFVSDRTGVGNIYIADLDSAAVYPITNLMSSAQQIDWSRDGKKIAFSTFHKAGFGIFAIKDPLSRRKGMADLPVTRFVKRLEGIQDTTVVERQEARRQARVDSTRRPAAPDSASPDTSAAAGRTARWVSDRMAAAETPADSAATGGAPPHTLPEKGLEVKPYRPKLRPEFFSANVGFDTFYGASGLAQLSLSDVLGNHRAIIASSMNFSLTDSDIYLAYGYLARQTDYIVSLYHTPVFFFSGGAVNVDRYYGGGFNVQRPFSRFNRVEADVNLLGIQRQLLQDTYDPYVGGGYFGGVARGNRVTLANRGAVITGGAFVDDTTMPGLFGPVDGRRARLSVERSWAGLDYTTVQLDYRKYARVLGDYTFAFRMAGGSSFGKNSTQFFLGGVNNAINPTFYTVAPVDDSRLFFSTFIWPLRGSEMFSQTGDSFLLGNAAFRFPIVRELQMGWPLPLLFRNVEGELFLDAGGAFDRKAFDPWDVSNGSLRLKDLRAGYGLGVRVNVGLFLFRYDLAWPTDFNRTYHPMQYFSLDYTGLF